MSPVKSSQKQVDDYHFIQNKSINTYCLKPPKIRHSWQTVTFGEEKHEENYPFQCLILLMSMLEKIHEPQVLPTRPTCCFLVPSCRNIFSGLPKCWIIPKEVTWIPNVGENLSKSHRPNLCHDGGFSTYCLKSFFVLKSPPSNRKKIKSEWQKKLLFLASGSVSQRDQKSQVGYRSGRSNTIGLVQSPQNETWLMQHCNFLISKK